MARSRLATAAWVLVPLLLLGALAALWVRGRRHADLLAVFGAAGGLNGAASFDHGVLLFFSEVPFGREVAWSARVDSVPANDFRPVFEALFDPQAVKWSGAGLKTARGQLAVGPATPSYTAVFVPNWLLLVLIVVPSLGRPMRYFSRRQRWARGGRCVS